MGYLASLNATRVFGILEASIWRKIDGRMLRLEISAFRDIGCIVFRRKATRFGFEKRYALVGTVRALEAKRAYLNLLESDASTWRNLERASRASSVVYCCRGM